MDIKNSLEVLGAVEAAADAAVKACEDGKLGLLDLRHLVPVLGKAKDAIADAALIRAELADADAAEVDALVAKLVVVVEKSAAAFSALSDVLSKAS